MHDKYIFDDAAGVNELRRLRMLESVFDEKTRRLVLSAGPLAGKCCLEVGAGAGSIAAWLSNEAGPTGNVTAVDTNGRFLRELDQRIAVVEGDFSTATVPVEYFDLVHARYVLIHNADARSLLAAMLRALKPGGALVLEEPDFSASAAIVGPVHLKQAVEAVRQAISAMFSSRGMNYAFGRDLPELIRDTGASVMDLEYDCPVAPGNSKLAEMMRLSTVALEEKYVGTGCATPSDIARYSEFAQSPDCWGIYYATVRVLARKRNR
jgi:ubiquinone/menaquinone biosynthesis C-methylase UbiE